MRKRIVIGVLLLIVLLLGAYLWFRSTRSVVENLPLAPAVVETVIGKSVQGRMIEAVTYGNANDLHLLFVGGIHGGYEWNSVLLAYAMMDYIKANPAILGDKIKLTIIPSLNPDGVFKVTGKEGRFTAQNILPNVDQALGRFNARGVDLNRNFACKWQAESTWRGQPVSAGTAAFSEPEAQALRDFVLNQEVSAVVFWHSQANAVYASECEQGILPGTLDLMNAYAGASGYKAVKTFDAYPITGDAEGWLASINIPAVTVELKNHESIDWAQNLAGVQAVIKYYLNLKN